jgi:hypothetical protein
MPLSIIENCLFICYFFRASVVWALSWLQYKIHKEVTILYFKDLSDICTNKRKAYFLFFIFHKPNSTSFFVLNNFLNLKFFKKKQLPDYLFILCHIILSVIMSLPVRWFFYFYKVTAIAKSKTDHNLKTPLELLYELEKNDLKNAHLKKLKMPTLRKTKTP